jgi:hypothetical protein
MAEHGRSGDRAKAQRILCPIARSPDALPWPDHPIGYRPMGGAHGGIVENRPDARPRRRPDDCFARAVRRAVWRPGDRRVYSRRPNSWRKHRSGWVGAALLYSITYTLAYWGPHITAWLTVPFYAFWRTQNIFALISVALGLLVFAMSRRAMLTPQRLLDVGLVYEVVASLGISVVQFWYGFPDVTLVDRKYTGIPWECAWIIIFPLLAPNAPKKVVIASLASASTGPLVVFLRMAAGVPIGRDPVMIVAFFLFSTYLCAIVAYVIAHIVYRYGVRLHKAREVGSYELVTKLGEGGMGEVWVARHRLLARPAAVKLIRP